jgi:hypothetical protein
MRHVTAATLSAILSLVVSIGAARAADTPERQFPLAASKLTLAGGTKPGARRLSFTARWSGAMSPMPNPAFPGTTLRIIGGPGEGDSGVIHLNQLKWRALPKGKGYRYNDPQGTAGGIKVILIRTTKDGGRVKIVGGSGNWRYQVTKPQSVITITMISDTTRWCAQLSSPKTIKTKVHGVAQAALASCPCDTYASTWEAIQGTIIARNSCTNSACHDSQSAKTSGGLDLTPEKAYADLVNAPSSYGTMRVLPFAPNDSLLWQKLAASTEGFQLNGKGSPMPSGLPAISEDELTAVRLWIQQGAPETGVVPDTQGLLDSCLPKPEPPADEPLAAPPPDQGVQLYAPPWTIKPRVAGTNGEDEVCYSTYYNLIGKVPTVPCGTPLFTGPTNPTGLCFAYNHQLLRQSPNSHHSIIHVYTGAYPSNDPSWRYECSGGTVADGTSCDPTVPGVAAPAGADCGGGYCRGKPISGPACFSLIGFGPPDYQGGATGNGGQTAPAFSGSQQPRFERIDPAGVYSELPVEGTIVWNSHAFNVFDVPIENQQWLNLWFTNDLRYPLRGVFDATDIFIQNVPPFQQAEYCRTTLFGKGTRMADLSSHTHKRGRLFRIWGPDNQGDPGIAQSCNSTQANPGTCLPEPTPPIMTTTTYNDPSQLIFTTPLKLDSDDPASRRYKFCAIYDNGYTDPEAVKRNSTSPNSTLQSLGIGGKCWTTGAPGQHIYCMNAAKRGQECFGNDRLCDSAPGANDGVCDACTLKGGVTTEDEMFIMIGSYYCDPAVPGETCTGVCSGGANKGEACHDDDANCPTTSCVTTQPAACSNGSTTGGWCATGRNRCTSCTTDTDCGTATCLPYTNN